MKKKLNLAIFFFLLILSLDILAIEKVIVSNERSNTLTILSKNGDLISEIGTCGRPRGMHFSLQKKKIFCWMC